MSGIGMGLAALNIGAKLTGAKAALAKIPPKAWLAIGIGLALVVGFFWHQHSAHKALKAAGDAGYARAMNDVAERQKKIDAAALKLKQKVDRLTTKISTQEHQRYDQSVSHSGALADELRHRPPPRPQSGSGQALPGASASAGAIGNGPSADAGLAQIPWLPLIDRAEQCDNDHAARVGWDRWYAQVAKAWPH